MRTAIIGLACLFPGAPDLEHFWRNIVGGVDAIGEVPPSRWDPALYDPASDAVDRFYCKRGGFVDAYASFDPLRFGVVPKAVNAAEPDQLLTLRIGYDALRDAGYEDKPFARDRTGVIIGRGNYVSAGVLRLEQHVRLLPQILQTLQDLFPAIDAAALETVRTRLRQEFSYYGPDVAAGLIPNLIASRLANRLDLHGPAYSVDAACASSLIAVEQACQLLHRRQCEMMLVGGAHLTHDLTFWATFCQLGALSRSGVIRPLAANADGILAGEGVGLAVLKRLDDALDDGDRIYAVIEGVGSSSDGRSSSLVAPSVKGQRIALDRAWQNLPFDRSLIGLVEAHGTGTPTGDAVEIETLGEFFGSHRGEHQRAVVGSVKSMIGHAMPASGMASLIKTALSIHHGILPPTLNCDQPNRKLADTRFRTIGRSESWHTPQEERIGAVNAFGFGGINAHVVLRGMLAKAASVKSPKNTSPAPAANAGLQPLLVLSASTPEALLARFDRGENDLQPQPGRCRLVVVAPNAKKLDMARKAIVLGKRWNGRQQIWFSPEGLLTDGSKLAFVFPGVDSIFQPSAADLASYFKRPLPRYCETLDPAHSLVKVVIGLLGFNRFIYDILIQLGIHAQGYAGHSVGEWSAMLCGGMMDQALSDRTNAGLDIDSMTFPDVQFLAANCGEQPLSEAMEGLDQIAMSHDNCPHQVIACGRRASIATLALRLNARGIVAQVLPFVSGFHSSLFANHMQWYRDFFSAAQLTDPAIPVWSATTTRPYPASMPERQQLALEHLLQPVRFRSLVEAMYDDGFRVFVEVGAGSLTGFITDTLSGRPHHAIQSNHERRSGLEQLQQLCAALWVEGANFDTALLAQPDTTATAEMAGTGPSQMLSLGVPLVRIREPLQALPPTSPLSLLDESLPADGNEDAVAQLMRETLADIQRAGRDVLALWQQRRSLTPITSVTAVTAGLRRIDTRLRRVLDLESTIPYVTDHELYPQREGWPIVADRYPVVPITMEIMLVREAVEEVLPGLYVVEVSQVKAYNWLTVAAPVTVDITLRSVSDSVIEAEIVGYFKASVQVVAQFAAPDSELLPAMLAPRATAIDAQALYRDRWMFHGPAYRGVREMSPIGSNGIDGVLEVPTGKGALLDNMGQLAGYWVMEQPDNCLAMPIGVDRVRFFAADPQPGELLQCQVRIAEIDELNCVSNLRLYDTSGQLRVAIDGWRTRRYQMDKAFWVASRLLSQLQASQFLPPNVALFEDRYDTAILRDYIGRRYLSASERTAYEEQPPKLRRQWLSGRVVAKDAVRAWLGRHRGATEVFPQEIRIGGGEGGQLSVEANVTSTLSDALHLSVCHLDGLSAAIVDTSPVGIHIERIGLQATDGRGEVDTDQSLATRRWVARVVASIVNGGNPRRLAIQEYEGDCFKVDGHWVVTHLLSDSVIGWSLNPTPYGRPSRTSSSRGNPWLVTHFPIDKRRKVP